MAASVISLKDWALAIVSNCGIIGVQMTQNGQRNKSLRIDVPYLYSSKSRSGSPDCARQGSVVYPSNKPGVTVPRSMLAILGASQPATSLLNSQ